MADTPRAEQAKPTTTTTTTTAAEPTTASNNSTVTAEPNATVGSDADSDTAPAMGNLQSTNARMADAMRAGARNTGTNRNGSGGGIPTTLFFYGTLQDPGVLQSVTRLTRPLPPLEDARIEGGFDMRLWGRKYPVIVANPDSRAVIKGKVWRVTEADGFGAEEWARLERYETAAYDATECVVRVRGEDGWEEVVAAVFKWAGTRPSGELSDGVFDLDVWRQKYR